MKIRFLILVLLSVFPMSQSAFAETYLETDKLVVDDTALTVESGVLKLSLSQNSTGEKTQTGLPISISADGISATVNGAVDRNYLPTQRAVKAYIDYFTSGLDARLARVEDNAVGMATMIDSFVGMIAPFAVSSNITPTGGWLECNGQYVSQADYPELWNAIRHTYAQGSLEPGKFRLPDLRDRVAIGAGSGAGLTTRVQAQTGGGVSVTLGSTDYLPRHNHSVNSTSHTHAIYDYYCAEALGGTQLNQLGTNNADDNDNYIESVLTDQFTGYSLTGITLGNYPSSGSTSQPIGTVMASRSVKFWIRAVTADKQP